MIALDTNQLDRHSLVSPLMAILKVLSRRKHQRLVISEVTYNEHCAHYENRLRRAHSQETKVHNDLDRLLRLAGLKRKQGVYIRQAVEDRIREASAAYQAEILKIFDLVELDGDSAIEALRREARRIPPASSSFDTEGSGARDVAIWLSLLRESARLAEVLYFISSDKRAFKASGDITEDEEPQSSVIVVSDIGELLVILADEVEISVDLNLIETSEVIHRKIVDYIDETETMTNIYYMAIEFPTAQSLRSTFADLVHIDFLNATDIHGHIIGDETWITARASWNISRDVQIDQLRRDSDTESLIARTTWNVSFQIVTSLIFKAATNIEDVEVLNLGKPSQIIAKIEDVPT